MSAVQISEYATMKNGNGVTSSDRMYFWKDDYRPYIRTITFGNDLSNLPSNCTEENLCFDVTGDGNTKKVYGYLIDSGLKDSNNPEQSLYNLYIVSEAPIFAPQDCSLFFAGFNNLVNINYNNNFNTSKVTNMSYMFLPALPGDWSSEVVLTTSNNDVKPTLLNKINNSDVELMAAVGLSYYSSLENLDLGDFNTSNVTNMNRMFSNCQSLTSLDLSGFNTSKVTDMSDMFFNCSSLTSIDLNSFNTSKVTNILQMFSYCESLTSLDLSSFNTSNVTNMYGMFEYCSTLTSLDLNSFNTLSVTDMSYMFYDCSSLISLDLSGFNALIGDLLNSRTFSSCTSLKYLDISNCYFLELDEILYALKDSTNLLTTINITNFRYSINQVFYLTSAKITINYTSVCEAKLDAYLAAHPDYNWVKGKLITAPSSN